MQEIQNNNKEKEKQLNRLKKVNKTKPKEKPKPKPKQQPKTKQQTNTNQNPKKKHFMKFYLNVLKRKQFQKTHHLILRKKLKKQ